MLCQSRRKSAGNRKKLRKLKQGAGEYSTHTPTDTNTVHKH